MIHFIVWIVVSGFAGFVASKVINKTGSGLFIDILLGMVGGFVGGFIVNHVPFLSGLGGRGGMGGFIVEVIVAIGGAMLVIFLYDLLFRRKA
ncbi:MAG TPA: GlsB/YeaQ/YmgE family stress response membrane protein [Caulobacteraceae bacterium]|nr:GlsB/YeaQ/YmgE family stress response membrane protein [Caulobacteraceae bacterium]